MNRKNILSLLLAALLLVSATACGEAQTETTGTDLSGMGNETTADTDIGYADGLPERNFEGKVFTALVPEWTATKMTAEELTGEVLNDALYNRDRTVEGRFNAVVVESICDDVTTELQNVMAAGDDLYDVVSSGIVALGIDVMQGWYLNAREIPYVNFDQPWYSSEVTEALTYKDKTFIFISDYSVSNMDMTECMLWNLDLAEEYALDNIYDVVLEGKWTKDKLEEMCLGAYKDVNGNGVRDEEDRYGLSLDFMGDPSTIPFHFGHRILEKQSDGTFKDVFYDEALISQVEWMYNMTHNEEAVTCENSWNHGINTFVGGNVLCSYIRINMISWGLRDLDINYAIIPRPKWDENQTKYYSTLAGSADAMVFIKTLQDREFAGIMLEALAATSHDTAVPAYYEDVLTYKLARDERTIDMVELIMDGRMYDFGYVYGAFESNGGGAAFWLNKIAAGNGDLTSYYQARKSNWENYMASVYAQFDNYKDE